ncbi:hypothetical protein GCM10027579_18690 [Calidifontibacter terrae]
MLGTEPSELLDELSELLLEELSELLDEVSELVEVASELELLEPSEVGDEPLVALVLLGATAVGASSGPQAVMPRLNVAQAATAIVVRRMFMELSPNGVLSVRARRVSMACSLTTTGAQWFP